MKTSELPSSLIRDIALPVDKIFETQDKLLLVLQALWATLLAFMDIIVAAYFSIFPPPAKSLKGQVVLVTGGGRGLGRGLALGFAKEGCKVAVADVNVKNALNTAADIRDAGGVAKAYLCNVASPDDIKALRQSVTADLGPVDVLVNNAGLIYGGDLLEDCQERDIRAVIEVNLMSHFWSMKEFLPTMKARNSGHIVAIASAGSYLGGETGSVYISSKFGVRGLMEVVRAELDCRPNNNIRTTTVHPSFINTSADYVDQWDIRLAPMSIDDVVEATIAGVKVNKTTVFIPSYIRFVALIAGFLPPRAFDRYKSLVVFKISPMKSKGDHTSENGTTKNKES